MSFMYSQGLYPARRRLIARRDIDGHVQRYEYDSLGRVAKIIDPFGGETVPEYATTSDTSFPVGALKATALANGTQTELQYDALGRMIRSELRDPTSALLEYLELTYNDLGQIEARERGGSGGELYTMEYDYDGAGRLTREQIMITDSPPNPRWWRTYNYDQAGNRVGMNYDTAVLQSKSTTFTYGNRNQLLSSSGYWYSGMSDTGSISYSHDAKGNMTGRNGQSYEWNEDNRLTRAIVSDPKAGAISHFYKYDHAGRRILSHTGSGGQRTRHFFSGLTEEVRKVSVGTHADNSFGFLEKITGDGGMSDWNSGSITSVYDEELHTYVTELPAGTSARSGQHHEWNPGGSTTWGITDKRVLSAWVKVTGGNVHINVVMRNTQGETRSHLYWVSSSPPTTGMDVPFNYSTNGTRALFHTNLRRDGQWHRLERDLVKDFEAAWPGETFQQVAGLVLSAQSSNAQLWLANVRLSNSMTVEKNVLGAGQIGHILQNRTIDTAATYEITDRWFHYDQVGSVTATTDADGALVSQRHADAFGNTLEDWETGLWMGESGWGHNTKEHNAATGLVYMYQRHYLPETGTFLSTAPYPPMIEHEYTIAEGNPVGRVDPDGRRPVTPADEMAVALTPDIMKKSDSGVCDRYCEGDTYMGFDAKCVCENTGEKPWDQFVRGCLGVMHERGVNPRAAHISCYDMADKIHGSLPGYQSKLYIGIALQLRCGLIRDAAWYPPEFRATMIY